MACKRDPMVRDRDETETFDFQSETRSRPRPSHVSTRPRRLESTSRDRLETETSRPRLHPCWSVQTATAFLAAQIKVCSIAHRCTKSPHSRRSFSKLYYLPVGGVDIHVCKKHCLRQYIVSLMEELPVQLTQSIRALYHVALYHVLTNVVDIRHITKHPNCICKRVH